MPEGYDISENNGTYTGPWGDFVIVRGVNEWGRLDAHAVENIANAHAAGVRVGVYGWPIPGHDNYQLGGDLVRTYPGATCGYWADVESSDAGLVNADEVTAYLHGIEAAGGLAGFYSPDAYCYRSEYLDSRPWWMADYGPNDGTRHDPFEQPPFPPRDYQIHQYSSAGNLDRNWCENFDWLGETSMAFDLNDLAYLRDHVTGLAIDGQTPITNLDVLNRVAEVEKKIDTIPGVGTQTTFDITTVPSADLIAELTRRLTH